MREPWFLKTGDLLETGDLTSTIGVESNDETGQFAKNFRTVVEGQRGTLMAIRRSTDSLGLVIAKLSEAGMSVSSGAVTIQSLVRDTQSSIENMLSSLRGVSINVDGCRSRVNEVPHLLFRWQMRTMRLLPTWKPWLLRFTSPRRQSIE